MKGIKIGKYVVPLWTIVVLLVAGIGASAYYVWKTLIIPMQVKEPLEIISYPTQLSLYPGETKEFNVTIKNYASVNYPVILDFSLDNTTYQESYVTFSNEIYTIIPGMQNITAWLKVESHAPPINASLTIKLKRIIGEAVIFFDDFNDGVADGWTQNLGTWYVVDGKYVAQVPGIVETGISTVDFLNLTDFVIEVKIRFTDDVGFLAQIIFRYTDNQHYYAFGLSNEYDTVPLTKYSPSAAEYGKDIACSHYPIEKNKEYTLRVEIKGNTFTCFINGVKLYSGTDNTYRSGKVGLRARRAIVQFDNFKVTSIP
ncbi:MAG: family 16 glycoside hydrolase [Candidatus Bathyarchaeia archaeon]